MVFNNHKAVYLVSAWYITTCPFLHPSKYYPLRYDLRELYIDVCLSWKCSSILILFSCGFSPSINFILSLTQPDRRSVKLITSLAVKTTNYSKSLLLFMAVKRQITFVSQQHGYGSSMTGISVFW